MVSQSQVFSSSAKSPGLLDQLYQQLFKPAQPNYEDSISRVFHFGSNDLVGVRRQFAGVSSQPDADAGGGPLSSWKTGYKRVILSGPQWSRRPAARSRHRPRYEAAGRTDRDGVEARPCD